MLPVSAPDSIKAVKCEGPGYCKFCLRAAETGTIAGFRGRKESLVEIQTEKSCTKAYMHI